MSKVIDKSCHAGMDEPEDGVPMIADHELEDRLFRAILENNEGFVSFNLAAGDCPGEIHVNVQFEGPVGQHEYCMANQGAVLAAVSRWLRTLLELDRVNYVIRLNSWPGDPNALERAAGILENGESNANPPLGPDNTHDNQIQPKNQNENPNENA